MNVREFINNFWIAATRRDLLAVACCLPSKPPPACLAMLEPQKGGSHAKLGSGWSRIAHKRQWQTRPCHCVLLLRRKRGRGR